MSKRRRRKPQTRAKPGPAPKPKDDPKPRSEKRRRQYQKIRADTMQRHFEAKGYAVLRTQRPHCPECREAGRPLAPLAWTSSAEYGRAKCQICDAQVRVIDETRIRVPDFEQRDVPIGVSVEEQAAAMHIPSDRLRMWIDTQGCPVLVDGSCDPEAVTAWVAARYADASQ